MDKTNQLALNFVNEKSMTKSKKSGFTLTKTLKLQKNFEGIIHSIYASAIRDKKPHSFIIERLEAEVYYKNNYRLLAQYAKEYLRGYNAACLEMIYFHLEWRLYVKVPVEKLSFYEGQAWFKGWGNFLTPEQLNLLSSHKEFSEARSWISNDLSAFCYRDKDANGNYIVFR